MWNVAESLSFDDFMCSKEGRFLVWLNHFLEFLHSNDADLVSEFVIASKLPDL